MIAGPWRRQIKDGVMSDDSDHTIATATVASEETPYGVRINVATHATEPPTQWGVLIP